MRIRNELCGSGEATILKFRFADKAEKVHTFTRLHGALNQCSLAENP